MVVSTASYSFHCAEAGSRSHPPVLFLHGFMGSGEDWRSVMEKLASDRYCIAPDLPGHGRTTVHGGDELFGMEYVAEGLGSLLRELGVGTCDIVGYSMGGRLALYCVAAVVHPVGAVVLESASPGLRTAEERAARRLHDEALAQELDTAPFDVFLERWYNQPLFAPLRRHPGFPQVLDRRRRNTPSGLALSLRRMGTGVQPPLWDVLPSIDTPTLLLAGEYDAKFIGIGNAMQALFPRASLRIVEQAGHTIHVEQEQRYTELLRDFLRGSV